jgi:hypothetical protein
VGGLQVIPQLIARIDTPRPLVSRLIHQLLTDVGKHHPQAGFVDHIGPLATLENREIILLFRYPGLVQFPVFERKITFENTQK